MRWNAFTNIAASNMVGMVTNCHSGAGYCMDQDFRVGHGGAKGFLGQGHGTVDSREKSVSDVGLWFWGGACAGGRDGLTGSAAGWDRKGRFGEVSKDLRVFSVGLAVRFWIDHKFVVKRDVGKAAAIPS